MYSHAVQSADRRSLGAARNRDHIHIVVLRSKSLAEFNDLRRDSTHIRVKIYRK